MKVSISLGGSLLTRDQIPPTFRRYAEVLRELKGEGHQLIVVCGGGRTAREYIEVGKKLGADRETQDRLGILATHLNALLLIAALGSDAHPHIHRRGTEIKRHKGERILVGGGHLPGSSTDYRAVLFAKAAGADLIINATDIDGVYDKNPDTHPDAEKLERITYSRLEEIILENARQQPGEYGLFDLKAVRLVRKLGTPLIFIDGSDPREIVKAVEGGHSGTIVR
ncbi:MAG: UMP kinase [Candidatus Bathyarchaeota archaeon]|jgi:uridylate kinase